MTIPYHASITAIHFTVKQHGRYVLRGGETTRCGDSRHEELIEMCVRGLHASMSIDDARRYAPVGAVPTRVKVWGRVQFGRDKLVGTDRKIIEEIEE
jgi:hypothetical protein